MKPKQLWITAMVLSLTVPVFAASMERSSVVLPELNIRLETAGAWHAMDIDNKNGNAPDMSTGFAAALGNLHIFATLVDGIDVFTEYYLSSQHHQGAVYDNEGYVLIKKLPERINVGPLESIFNVIDLKGGHFEVDYGNQHWVRSDEAEVQRNPLVGNFVVDPQMVEGGAEIMAHLNYLHLVYGMGNGVTNENYYKNREYSHHGKVLFEPESKKFNLAFSVYALDQSKNPIGGNPGGASGNLFAGARSASRYSGLNPATGASDSDFAQLLLGNGQDVFAWQTDAGFEVGPFWVSGLFGFFEDADTDGFDPTNVAGTQGEPEDQWKYYGADIKVDVTENGYLAARWSGASADRINSVDSPAKATRYQVGYGYHLFDGILFKLEYMNQKMDEFPTTGNSSYTKYANDVKIDGVTMELSVAFGNSAPYEHSTSSWGTEE